MRLLWDKVSTRTYSDEVVRNSFTFSVALFVLRVFNRGIHSTGNAYRLLYVHLYRK